MNNHHLFLIRPDYVTQLLGHLVAGMIALVLVFCAFAPKENFRPDTAPAAPAARIALPAGTTVLASSQADLR